MLFVIIFWSIIIILSVFLLYKLYSVIIPKYENNSIGYNYSQSDFSKPFSIKDYYDRMQKVADDILKEQESKPNELLTLWIGLDGLQMNSDDTLEWISKYIPEKIEKPLKCSCPDFNYSYFEYQNMNALQPSNLQMQNNLLQLQSAQIAQTQLLINSSNRNLYPYWNNPIQQNLYHCYWNSPYSTNALSQCCCNSTLWR